MLLVSYYSTMHKNRIMLAETPVYFYMGVNQFLAAKYSWIFKKGMHGYIVSASVTKIFLLKSLIVLHTTNSFHYFMVIS